MKKVKAVIVGYGNRGSVYADYSFEDKENFQVVGVVDINPFRLGTAKERYGLNDDQLFSSLEDFLSKKLPVDIIINTTMDQDHYSTSMKILSAGYNMLVEKPVVNNKKELLDIANLAKKNSCLVFVCHVLRYTPFYSTIKQCLLDGVIGSIITMEMNEHVAISHYLTSFCRGKWGDEDVCGSPFLLAKCCHDMDLIAWLNNASTPKRISSFGNRALFTKENMPADATEYCYQCPNYESCIYSAKYQYLVRDDMPFLTWADLNKPLDEITMAEKEEFLKHDNFGKCAYIAGGNLVDRQNLIIEFENGSCVSFTLAANATKPQRYIHIVGTKGEIEGVLESNILTIRRAYQPDEVIDLSQKIINKVQFGGHSGGDHAIMQDIVAYFNGDRTSISMTHINDSINGHLIVYAAEESRKNGMTVTL